MSSLGQTLKSYFWWTSPRGSVPYDVMVTLILAFIFLVPHWINFRDKPVERSPHQTEVVVQPVGDGFIYKVDAAAVKADSDDDVRDSLERAIEPVSGSVTIDRWEAVRDSKNKVVAYKAWARR